ncbi:unnamed protein product [Sphagnum troendelagicum]
MVQAKTHVDLVKPSLSMSAVKNQYMDFAREQLRSSGSYETQNTASGNRSLFVRSSSTANTPTSLMEKNSAGGAPEFSNWKNPEVTSSDSIPCSLTTVTFGTTQDRVAGNSSCYDGRPRLLSYGVLRSMPCSVHYCDSRHHDALHRLIQLN